MLCQLFTSLLVALLMIQSVRAFSWAKQHDTKTCSLSQPDLQKITDMFIEARSEDSAPVNVSLVELDLKLQKVLELVVAMQCRENSTLLRSEDEEPLSALEDALVHNDTQEIEILTEEEMDVEQPKQESLTDKSELHMNDTQQENQVFSNITDNNIEKLEENILNETVIPDDNKISSFRPPVFLDNVEKGGCEALVHNSHETIGMFYITSFRHGHCANREPLTSDKIRKCLGYCSSKTFLDRELGHEWRQGHECYSCQPEQMEVISILLECEDGYTFHKKYSNVVACKCKPCQVKD